MNNELSFETYQWASGHYLIRPLPDNWNKRMTTKDKNDFLEGNACAMYEYWDADDIWSEIEHLAIDAHKFFNGRTQ